MAASACFNKWFIESLKSSDSFKTADLIRNLTSEWTIESLPRSVWSKTDSHKEQNTVLLYILVFHIIIFFVETVL